MEHQQQVNCPECYENINDGLFSVDSEVSGHIDIGYNCERCEIDVYVYKVERDKGGNDECRKRLHSSGA